MNTNLNLVVLIYIFLSFQSLLAFKNTIMVPEQGNKLAILFGDTKDDKLRQFIFNDLVKMFNVTKGLGYETHAISNKFLDHQHMNYYSFLKKTIKKSIRDSGDTLLLLFSAHGNELGVCVNESWFGTQTLDAWDLYENLEPTLKKRKLKRLFILVDTCHAGYWSDLVKSLNEENGKFDPEVKELAQDYLKLTEELIVFVASSKEGLAYESNFSDALASLIYGTAIGMNQDMTGAKFARKFVGNSKEIQDQAIDFFPPKLENLEMIPEEPPETQSMESRCCLDISIGNDNPGLQCCGTYLKVSIAKGHKLKQCKNEILSKHNEWVSVLKNPLIEPGIISPKPYISIRTSWNYLDDFIETECLDKYSLKLVSNCETF